MLKEILKEALLRCSDRCFVGLFGRGGARAELSQRSGHGGALMRPLRIRTDLARFTRLGEKPENRKEGRMPQLKGQAPRVQAKEGRMPQPMSKRRTGWAVLAVTALVGSLFAVGATPAGAEKGKQDLAMDTNPACAGAAMDDYGFADVAENVHMSAINCLAHYQISRGLAVADGEDPMYDPAGNVTRRQMALLMQRTAMRTNVTLDDVTSQGLTDIASEPTAIQDAINQMVAAGIMTGQGTTGTMFTPAGMVSRADMALIVARLLAKASDQVMVNAASGNFEIYALGSTTPFMPDDRFDDARTYANSDQYSAIVALV